MAVFRARKDSVTLLAKALFELIRLYKDLQYSNNESILNIYSMKKNETQRPVGSKGIGVKNA